MRFSTAFLAMCLWACSSSVHHVDPSFNRKRVLKSETMLLPILRLEVGDSAGFVKDWKGYRIPHDSLNSFISSLFSLAFQHRLEFGKQVYDSTVKRDGANFKDTVATLKIKDSILTPATTSSHAVSQPVYRSLSFFYPETRVLTSRGYVPDLSITLSEVHFDSGSRDKDEGDGFALSTPIMVSTPAGSMVGGHLGGGSISCISEKLPIEVLYLIRDHKSEKTMAFGRVALNAEDCSTIVEQRWLLAIDLVVREIVKKTPFAGNAAKGVFPTSPYMTGPTPEQQYESLDYFNGYLKRWRLSGIK